MTEAHRRKKSPEALRVQLLDSAANIAVERGIQALTLEAVSARAGVTKGGLQHHFRSKQALLDALFEEAMEQFRQAVLAAAAADPEPTGRMARAYLNVTIQPDACGIGGDVMRRLLALMLAEPDQRERWNTALGEFTRPDPVEEAEAARLMIVRLAADGIWIADLLGYGSMSPSLRVAVIDQLRRMTEA